MEVYFTWFGILVATVILLGLGAWAVIEIVHAYGKWKAQRDYNDTRDSVLRELNQLERWCGYDFPILEDLSKYLRHSVCEGVQGDISRFRDGLRKKYLENNRTGAKGGEG